ncbi:MAG: peptide-binding protein [Lentisphaeria bacterium]|nr:peptide-binding protein [Lentisphaeria bacterium]
MRLILQIIIICLLAANCFLFYTMTVSFDRARKANVILAGKLQTVSGAKTPAEKSRRSGDFANREYFSPDAVDGGELVTVISSDPPGLNPLLTNEKSASDIFALCSLTLAERDWKHREKYRPVLAESFSISPDNKSYRIKLRKGVKWQSFTDPDTGIFHPAKEITAHDIKFTVDTILDPGVNCAALRGYYSDISEVKIINDHEFIVSWKKEYYGSKASTLSLFPLPRHFYCPDGKFDAQKFNNAHSKNRMIISCGAYILRSWENSKEIVLERNPDYIGFDFGAAPPIPRRIFKIIKLPNTRFQALLAGKINLLGLSAEQWFTRTDTPEFNSGAIRKIRYPDYTSYNYIGYNHKVHCFGDAATRRALTMLVNRQAILDKLYFGCGKISKGPFIPGSVYSDSKLEPLPFAPEEAKKLLAQAGWKDTDGDGILERDGKKFTFTMLQISGATTQHRMLLMVKNDFAAAGIDMKLQTVEWNVLLERLKNQKFEACSLGWANSDDPDLYQIFHSSQSNIGGDNFISFRNNELDKLIVDLRREFDMDKRIKMNHRIEKLIHEEQPYTFLFCFDSLVAVSSQFKNIKLYPNRIYPISFYWQEDEKNE